MSQTADSRALAAWVTALAGLVFGCDESPSTVVPTDAGNDAPFDGGQGGEAAGCGAPFDAPADAVIADVVAGHGHSCARFTDGSAWCWGTNYYGELGNLLPMVDFDTAVRAEVVDCAVELSLGHEHSCFGMLDGSLWCWGLNGYGQLGNGGTPPTLTPTQVLLPTKAIQMSSFGGGSCAVTEQYDVWCWGHNVLGGWPGSSSGQSDEPLMIGLVAREVCWGNVFGCGIRHDGELWCWGHNDYGQLGDGTFEHRVTPAPVVGLTDVVQADTFGSHACAVTESGELWCWGKNTDGLLGTGDFETQSLPGRVEGLSHVAQVATSLKHTCVRLDDGSVTCWGSNSGGELGDGTGVDSLTPILVPGLSDVVDIAAGLGHTIALRADGEVLCWGWAPAGECGIDPPVPGSSIPTPTPVSWPPGQP